MVSIIITKYIYIYIYSINIWNACKIGDDINNIM